MRKICYIALFAAAAVLNSCQGKSEPEVSGTPVDKNAYPIEITFHSVDSFKSKTVLNDEAVLWESSDVIKVLWGANHFNTAVAKPYNSGMNAEFTTTVEDAPAYYGVYPASVVSSLTDGVLGVSVPSVQSGVFADANIAVAKADENNNMLFSHLVGYIEFTTDITGVLEISGGESNCLSGEVKVTGFDQYGKPEYEVVGGSSSISIDVKASGTYYIAVLPDAKMDHVYMTMTEGEDVKYILSTNSLQFVPGKLIALGNITERFSSKRPIGATLEQFEIVEFEFDNESVIF